MFIPTQSKPSGVQAQGPKEAKIVIVGDYPSAYDMRSLRPFSGPEGGILEQCLHNVGLIRGEIYITHLFKDQSAGANYNKGSFTETGLAAISALREELSETSANIIIAMGEAAFCAVAGSYYLSRYRGYVFQAINFPQAKCIGTIHPREASFGLYKNRYLIVADLKKAISERDSPLLVRPSRTLIYHYENINEALEWLTYFNEQPRVSIDIEVLNYEVSCIGFSSNPNLACVFPISGSWSVEDEFLLWRGIAQVLGNQSQKVFQNGIFDIQFLLAKNNIVTRGEILDTMIAHSVMYPDLPKNLGFLGSIYCGSQEYWKDTVKFSNIKGES